MQLKNTRFIYSTFSNEIDYAKLSRSTVANYIQFLDAFIAHSFLKISRKSRLPCFTIHDRFFYSWVYALDLKRNLRKSYLLLYAENSIAKNFTSNPNLTSFIRVSTDLDFLRSTDLLHPNFVKS